MEAIAHDESDFERRASGRELDSSTDGASSGIPSPDIWAGISADERAYRKRVLNDIARRVAEEGVHTAVPGDDRGRQFMPFAALKGYDDVIAEVEESAASACRQE